MKCPIGQSLAANANTTLRIGVVKTGGGSARVRIAMSMAIAGGISSIQALMPSVLRNGKAQVRELKSSPLIKCKWKK